MVIRVISGKVTGRRLAKNRDGDHAVRLLQAELSDPADVQSVELMSQTGEESNPPDGSTLCILSIGRAWKIAVACDDKIAPATAVGEKRIYSTDATGAAVAAQIHLKNDGTLIADNGAVTITATPGGELKIKTGTSVEITSPTTIINSKTFINNSLQVQGTIKAADVIFAGRSAANHTHPENDGDNGGNTGAPN
ncbi:MAG: hypothetical protein GY874_02660 [Desulfobacteraceae bacterium]|nr:hypothetical protein [Desulfobacteraceae bacterium]